MGKIKRQRKMQKQPKSDEDHSQENNNQIVQNNPNPNNQEKSISKTHDITKINNQAQNLSDSRKNILPPIIKDPLKQSKKSQPEQSQNVNQNQQQNEFKTQDVMKQIYKRYAIQSISNGPSNNQNENNQRPEQIPPPKSNTANQPKKQQKSKQNPNNNNNTNSNNNSNQIKETKKRQQYREVLKLYQKITNQIMVQDNNNIQQKHKKRIISVYLPGYMRVKFKNFTLLQQANLMSKANLDIIYNIKYGNIIQYLQQQKIINKNKQTQQVLKLFQTGFILNISKNGFVKLAEYEQNQEDQQQKQRKLKRQRSGKPKDQDLQKILKKRNLNINVKHNKQQKNFKYTVRKQLAMTISSNPILSPFETITSTLEVQAETLEYQVSEDVIIYFHINLMDNPQDTDIKITYGEQKQFANYGLALNKFSAQYTNQRIYRNNDNHFQKLNKQNVLKIQDDLNYKQIKQILQQIKNYNQKKIKSNSFNKTLTYKQKKQPDLWLEKEIQRLKLKQNQKKIGLEKQKPQKQPSQIKPFKYAYFKIPLYKFPGATLGLIIVPILIIALLNLAIYFQSRVISSRIAAIASLLIAMSAFYSLLKQRIPPGKNLVFLQFCIYYQLIMFLLTFGESLTNKHQFRWQGSMQYIISVGANFVIIACLIFFTVLHYCKWQPKYKTPHGKKRQFNQSRWRNQACAMYFSIERTIENEKQLIEDIKNHIYILKSHQRNIQKYLKDILNEKYIQYKQKNSSWWNKIPL